MKYYLLRPEGTYSDAAEYLSDPPARDDGQWVEGEPEGLSPYAEVPIIDRLKAILMQLPLEVQVQFGAVAAAVDLQLRNSAHEAAKLTIQGVSVPWELEAVKAQMLEQFLE